MRRAQAGSATFFVLFFRFVFALVGVCSTWNLVGCLVVRTMCRRELGNKNTALVARHVQLDGQCGDSSVFLWLWQDDDAFGWLQG